MAVDDVDSSTITLVNKAEALMAQLQSMPLLTEKQQDGLVSALCRVLGQRISAPNDDQSRLVALLCSQGDRQSLASYLAAQCV